jgi:2-(1,2-epoxy-1,2-dihydrophenyl)acetyl-CoA isomerase
MSDLLLTDCKGAVMTLTINRPALRNALGASGDGETFAKVVKAINADTAVRCVILTGAGSAFSAGGDIKAMREKSGMFSGSPLSVAEGYRNNIHTIIKSLWNIEVPVISAINGPAIGLGCDVACSGDVRICNASASFAASFLKMGIVPGDGGAWLLPRIIGLARAAELFFTARAIDAATALEWGFVSRVVPDEKLMTEAQGLASTIGAQPRDVLRMTKRLMRHGLNQSFEEVMEQSASLQALAHFTADHLEALNAFFEKRDPKFTGN